MKKKLVMLVGDDLRHVQGVHVVIDNFIKSKSFFENINFTHVYGGSHTVDVEAGGRVPMGADKGKSSYKFKRKVRMILRELLSSRFLPFALLKYYFNTVKPAKRCLQRLENSGVEPDFIIHHSLLSAYFYFKTHPHTKTKNAFIVHAEDDTMSQFFGVYPAFNGFLKKKFLAKRDFVYSKVDKVVYISKKACKLSSLPPEKKTVIYNGIDDFPYNFNEEVKEKVNFVCVGSMSGRKGQELVIQALGIMPKEELNKLHLYLVGDGGERVSLEKQVQNAKLEEYVTFMGVRMDVPEILKSQDVFIMPSISEGLSIASLEAIRAGLFLLMTDTGGNKEVMGEQGGCVVERRAEDIKDKICSVLNNNIITIEQKRRSRNHFLDNFTSEKFISGYEKMFFSL